MTVTLAGLFLFSICGCAALIVGGAAGAGTAVWLSGKLSQEFNAPYDRTIAAAKTALKSLNLELFNETQKTDVTRLKSKTSDGKDIWIDIRRISDNSSQIEVRVGAVYPDKESASEILRRIEKSL